MKDTADSGEMAYDQMIGADNPEGNKIVQDVVDALVAQARAVEGVVTALGLTIEVEGSDSLDNPSCHEAACELNPSRRHRLGKVEPRSMRHRKPHRGTIVDSLTRIDLPSLSHRRRRICGASALDAHRQQLYARELPPPAMPGEGGAVTLELVAAERADGASLLRRRDASALDLLRRRLAADRAA